MNNLRDGIAKIIEAYKITYLTHQQVADKIFTEINEQLKGIFVEKDCPACRNGRFIDTEGQNLQCGICKGTRKIKRQAIISDITKENIKFGRLRVGEQ